MIPKGNRRGGGQNLATHLLNAFNNERVEVAGLRGAVARDLHGAFAEWRALASATRCTKYLYSLSVNPDQAKYDLTRDQYLDYITRAEKNRLPVGWTCTSNVTPGLRCSWLTTTRSSPLMMKVPTSVISGISPK